MSAVFRVLAVLLIASFSAVPAADPGRQPSLPVGASDDWWSQVQRSIVLEEYAVVADDPAETEFRAVNPAHRFDALFNADGLRIAPTEANWEWGLSLTAWGRAGALEAADVVQLSADEDRIELDRVALTEWFVNRPDGLEHGFAIPVPPREDGDRLVFDLSLTGGLRPIFAEDGQAVDFYGSGNVGVLRYAKLVVTDAVGAVLDARMDPIAGGIRIVVDDSHAVYPITVDPLATSPSWTAMGEDIDAFLGVSVATAGDVNGDGYSDVIVGANGHAGSTGKVYLYLGGASGLSASASWTAVGEATGDQFGFAAATAGDVNGDGYSDVVVGAFANASAAGKTYLYLGGVSGLSASPSWTAVGETAGDWFGYSAATAGDVNGDGYSDLIIGAAQNGGYTGKTYLYLGGASGLAASPSWTAVGEAASDCFGSPVATAGDVNGDGYSDVLVGAVYNNGHIGKAYLYLGGAGGLSASPSWSSAGDTAGDYHGHSLATAGDVNGDGYSDVVVSATGQGGGAGEVHLYLGGASGLASNASWTAVGETPGDNFGRCVATAGDINGDGYSDVLVGTDYYSGNTGKAYLYLGGAAGLNASTSWTAEGENSGDFYGRSLATAGDVNGDGYSDAIVGATGHGGLAGKAYLYLGGASDLSVKSSWSPAGEAANSSFGTSLATAGDVNGDGYSDVVVGAWAHNGYLGKAYMFLGGASGLSASAAWTAVGEDPILNYGISVASAGDVNGDGYSDVIVGARGTAIDPGRVYIYPGGTSGLSATATWTADGEAAGDYFGTSVATAGDVNGDGYSDVVVGAHKKSGETGKAYLFLGGASGPSDSPSWTALGEATLDRFGYPVATAGDVNGDGYSDVVVGAFGYSGATGKAYLYLGGAIGLSATASWTAVGEVSPDWFASSLGTAGDVNGDGYSDVIVGAFNNSATGKAYLYLGGATGLSATASWTAVGEASLDSFGYSVASAGDVNGDGYSDVVIGAYGNFSNRGKAYLYLGGAIGLSTTASWTARGLAIDNCFGWPVAAAGDVNGDGFADVAIGEPGNNSYTGKTYLFNGGGGQGVPLVPRQLRDDLSAPIHIGGAAFEQRFRLGLTLRSTVGRVWRKLQWQIAPWGGTFALAVNPVQSDTSWYINPVAVAKPLSLDEDLQRYLWRARIKYHPAQSPFQPWSRWIMLSANGLHEADLLSTSQEAPPPCMAPDEELYITTVTLDGNGKPVLHYQDPNQPSAVTGYNVYRASAPTGPWTMIGSNVVDMDEGTPNIQYVDQTGDVGGPWFYEVAAWNGACGAEGPY